MPRTLSPVEEFSQAIYARDVERARTLLEGHAEVRAAINAPLGHFGSRPIVMAGDHLPLIDLLLTHGADINQKSDWWAGPFGILEFQTPAMAEQLIARGARVDIFAATHLNMLDRVRTLVEADPSQVHARGGDGKTALHYATNIEIARYLLDHGADVNARCVDHESTPAQYLVRQAPDVTRLLIARGARVDIFMAIALGDEALVERCLDEDPEALDHRIWQGKYHVAHDDAHAASAEAIGDRRGDIYRWIFDHNVTALEVAERLDQPAIAARLWSRATPVQQLLHACGKGDRATAESLVASHPGIVASLTPEQRQLIAHRAHGNHTAAVSLMVDLGFDPLTRGECQFEPIRWAVFQGNAELTQLLLQHHPPLRTPDASFGGTLLDNCVYGATHGWASQRGDFPATLRLLLAAGEQPDLSYLPTGRVDIDLVLIGKEKEPLSPNPSPKERG